MANQIVAGKYLAKVTDHGIKTDRNGKPMAVVRFGWNDNDGTYHEWNWQGSFATEKSTEIAIESLVNAGFIGNHPKELSDENAKCFDPDHECEIVVHLEEYDGKELPVVKYINRQGGAGIRDAVDIGSAEKAFGGMNLEGILAEKRSKVPPKAESAAKPANSYQPPPAPNGHDQGGVNLDDIPF